MVRACHGTSKVDFGSYLQEDFAHCLVVLDRMVFGEVIRQVQEAFVPKDSELVLKNAILNPIKFHVVGFGAALFDGLVGDSRGSGVVNLDWRGRLRVAHFMEGSADAAGFAGIVV